MISTKNNIKLSIEAVSEEFKPVALENGKLEN